MTIVHDSSGIKNNHVINSVDVEKIFAKHQIYLSVNLQSLRKLETEENQG